MNENKEQFFSKIILENCDNELYYVLNKKKVLYKNQDIELESLIYDKQNKSYYCEKTGSYYFKTEKQVLVENIMYTIKKYYTIDNCLEMLLIDAKKKKILGYQSFKNSIIIASKYNRNLAMMILEIDDYLMINDENYKKKITSEVAKVLVNTLRKTDIVGNYYAGSFLVGLTSTSLERAKNAASRLIKNISDIEIAGEKAHITCSMGVVTYDKALFENNLKKVLSCLQFSKDNGKNKVTYLEE